MKMPWPSRWMGVVFLLLVLLVSGCFHRNGQTFSTGQKTGHSAAVRVAEESPGYTAAKVPARQQMLAQAAKGAEGQPTTDLASAGQRGQTAVIAVPEQYPAIDPLGLDKREQELTPIERFAYEGLIQARPDQTYAPALASAFQAEPRAGRAVITVQLRPGLKWPDGTAVTVDDVRATLETYARPDFYGIWRSQMAVVEGASPYRAGRADHISGIVTDRDSQTVTIRLVQEDRSFLPILTAPLLSARQLAGKDMRQLEQLSRAGQLMGLGPFQAQAVEGADWTFAANPHYYAGTPRLQALQVRRLPADRTEAALRAGDVHLAWVSPKQAALLGKQLPAHVQLISTEAAGYHFLGFNLSEGATADHAVRLALAWALPPKTIVRDRFFGMGKIADGPLSPRSFAYKPQPLPVYDPKRAARTLAEKGYSKAHPLSLVIAYPQDAVRGRLFAAVQEAWRPLPVTLTAKALPADEFAAYVFGASPYDLYVFGWKDGPDPSVLSRIWHSREKAGELGFNASHYHNVEADRLLDRANRFLPEEERKRLYAKWQKLFSQDLPIMPLLRLPDSYAVAKTLHGVETNGAAHPFEHVWKWSLGE
ncbi:ABC transporter substrate-binding protein [Brevibacillus fluminis]|uniref:ABC transporter substrate-binding protein n=1 Tax=Brevibacillus fluminis TaxID=511487 RepID=UPI003F8C4834